MLGFKGRAWTRCSEHSRVLGFLLGLVLMMSGVVVSRPAMAAAPADQICPRPATGSTVEQPGELASQHGLLALTLKYRSVIDTDGRVRYCYISNTGLQSPTLRVAPSDRLVIQFQNELPQQPASMAPGMKMSSGPSGDICHGTMSSTASNLHFHGVSVPPVCHQDESMYTLVQPGQSFEYNFRMPRDNAPGLYWYHPHPHGFSEAQVQGGASGALIVENLQAAIPALVGLPERTYILRDQMLRAAYATSKDPALPSWDISINYVPIEYPEYKPAVIATAPGEKQLWRLVSASANTIFYLRLLANDVPQKVDVYAVDGVPISNAPVSEDSLFMPPGSRVEFTVITPAAGTSMQLVTERWNAGPTGDSAPPRPIATVIAHMPPSGVAHTTHQAAPVLSQMSQPSTQFAGLREAIPVRTRGFYFSQNGNGTEGGAGAADKFFITPIGQPVKQFDMNDAASVIVQQGTVEDWIIENQAPEDHVFHIHQVHFQVIEIDGVAVNDPAVRDTILVPRLATRGPVSSVKLRMDFRDPSIVGSFVYHCHILGHEDKGMMGKIEVISAPGKDAASAK